MREMGGLYLKWPLTQEGGKVLGDSIGAQSPPG